MWLGLVVVPGEALGLSLALENKNGAGLWHWKSSWAMVRVGQSLLCGWDWCLRLVRLVNLNL